MLGRALLYLAVNGGEYTSAQHRLSAAVERFPKQPSSVSAPGKIGTIAAALVLLHIGHDRTT